MLPSMTNATWSQVSTSEHLLRCTPTRDALGESRLTQNRGLDIEVTLMTKPPVHLVLPREEWYRSWGGNQRRVSKAHPSLEREHAAEGRDAGVVQDQHVTVGTKAEPRGFGARASTCGVWLACIGLSIGAGHVEVACRILAGVAEVRGDTAVSRGKRGEVHTGGEARRHHHPASALRPTHGRRIARRATDATGVTRSRWPRESPPRIPPGQRAAGCTPCSAGCPWPRPPRGCCALR
jgi:hypothetical protein